MLPVAVRTGLEPATPGVTGRYSNQLNYRTNCSDLCVFLERGYKGTQKILISKFFAYFFDFFCNFFRFSSYLSALATLIFLCKSLSFTEIEQNSAPSRIKPIPATKSTVATPTLNGSTSTNIERMRSSIPKTVIIPPPDSLNESRSPPKEIMMKL